MTGKDLVIVQVGGDLVPASRGIALVGEPGGAVTVEALPPREEPPPQIPKSRERDPELMTPLQAKRLINRVRRTSFYLGADLVAWETQYKDDTKGWRTRQLIPTTAKVLMKVMDDLEGRHASYYVRVHHQAAGPGRYSTGFLVVYG